MVVEHQLFSQEDYRLLQECIHCGLCLPACPTYQANGKEADSPRGRLVLMKALDRDPGVDVAGAYNHIDLCLGCLACQTVCPSGVQYGHLLERTRSHRNDAGSAPSWSERLALDWVTQAPKLRLLTALIRLGQRTRLDRVARALRLLPAALNFQLAGMPALQRYPFGRHSRPLWPAVTSNGERQGAVALFTGCVMAHWYGEVHEATVRVLRWNGFDVAVPAGQGCCGALHSHAGQSAEAERLLEINRDALQRVDAQALIVNAAGCGAQLRGALWPGDESPAPVDVAEWLAPRLVRPPRSRLTGNFTYDAPCHLLHAQGVRQAPLQLLSAACESLLPLPESELCCGGAGAYTLTQPEMSRQVLSRKIEHVAALSPDVLVTGNPGCQLQLQAGLRLAGLKIPVRHTVQVLDQAYQQDRAYRDAFRLDAEAGQA